MFYSDDDKEKLIKQFLPKIKHYALRYYHIVQSVLELDDLISAGIKGLLEALNKYDPSLNVPLHSFIDYRIRGAIIDEIRCLDVFSKEFRKKIQDLKNAYTALKQSGKDPTDEELANFLNITNTELQKVYQSITASDVISLDDFVMSKEGDKLNLLEVISDKKDIFEEINFRELKEKLSAALEKLPKIEKLVLSLYYYEELNMKEIAEILGVSLSRVSQIHGKALLKLRHFFEK
ncbi:MAG: sigma-70 family RNA polymerase sigma factor [Thermodesulfovibrio sp.]|jgi:RNA polymerase sigma factor for flagellar operon FliA|uniref:FliA/WhiG family RNA polymerase sigma factor n=2 Tax=Thermodesulfovibrio TaxID=28261 RepID=A0A2J6WPG5_9BACT|nr:MAG: FliA/WhiG family RNA polymerase sigma factor [Thermodesulfovibrio aggregans]